LLTGWDADGTPGPAQAGALALALPPGITTPLVLGSGGFTSQSGTTQMITPSAIAFFLLRRGADTNNNTDGAGPFTAK
jgi:hypothetical protein